MKKLLLAILVFAISISATETFALNIAEEEIYEQDFEQCHTGSSLENLNMKRMDAATGIYDVVKDKLIDGNQCGRYIKQTDGEMFLVQYIPKKLEGTVTVQIDYYTEAEEYGTIGVWGTTHEGASKTIASVSISAFTLRTGGNAASASLYKDAWNQIVIKIDTEEDIYSVWLNGAIVAESLPLTLPAKNVTFFRMNLQAIDKPFYFDNIVVSRTWEPLNAIEETNPVEAENMEFPEDGQLRVSDFGAIANDEEDDSDAVNRAVATAKRLGNGCKVIFDPGRYIFEKTVSGSRYIIDANGANNIELLGDNTEIYVCDPFSGVFDVRSTSNVRLEGFTVKYKIPPWVQGTIENANTEDGTFLLRVMEGYTVFDDSRYTDPTKPWGVAMQNDQPYMMRTDVADHFKFSKIEKVDDLLYRITPEMPEYVKRGTLKDGDKIIYTNRSLGVGPTIAGHDSADLTAKNITVHESADCLFVGTYLEGITTLENIKAEIDGDRWIVSNADGFHIQGSRGPVYIRDCSVEGLLDDCINIYQYAGIITEKTSDSSYQIKHTSPSSIPRVGETIIVYDPVTYLEKGRAEIQSIETISTTEAKIVLTSDILDVNAGSAAPEADTFTVADLRAPGTEITGNVFSKSRRFGFLVKSCDTLIENNVFKDMGDAAIHFRAHMSGPGIEGPFAENIIIRNNTFDNVAYRDSARRGGKTDKGACIVLPSTAGKYRPVKNITIDQNTFINLPQYAISASGVDGLTITGNKITASAAEKVIASDAGDIFVTESDNITITDNEIADMRDKVENSIYIDSTGNHVLIENNSIALSGSANEVEVDSGILKPDITIKKHTPVIDGDLDDWENISGFTVDGIESAFLFSNYTPEDLSYEGKYSWDEDCFYVALKVTDDIHNPASIENTATAWQYDSVQIAFDSERVKGIGVNGYTGLVLSEKCAAWRSSTVAGISNGEASDIRCTVKRDEGKQITYYEIAVPWNSVMPDGFMAENRKYIGVSMLINDSDGTGRKGYLEYFSGIGSAKNPEEYATALLIEKDEDATINFEFSDVKNHWAKNQISKMAFRGIINGVGDNKFEPEKAITFAEFASMLVRCKELEIVEYADIFSDVKSSDWFADALQTAANHGFIDGGFVNNGNIEPNKNITRADAASLIAKALHLERKTKESYLAEDIVYWQRYYMDCCIDAGIFSGYEDGTYRVNNLLTRAEAATILNIICEQEDLL